MTRRALPPPAVDRREGVRGALLHTLPGRAIVIGLAIKLAVFFVGLASGGVPPFFAVVDTVAGLAAALGLGYFGFRLIVLAKRRLLWRVRRKLILSYFFVGFVPAILIVVFFLLFVLLLFFNFSSYLLQAEIRNLLLDAPRMAPVVRVPMAYDRVSIPKVQRFVTQKADRWTRVPIRFCWNMSDFPITVLDGIKVLV
jgi:hypothetical protein